MAAAASSTLSASASPPPLPRPYEAPPIRGERRPPPRDDGKLVLVLNHPPNVKIFFRTGFSVIYQPKDQPDRLCKVPVPMKSYLEMHAVERRIFERLGPHPNLVRVTGMDDHGIWMERALYGCLRVFYKEDDGGGGGGGGGGAAFVSPAMRLQWCEDVARVLAFVHAKGIRHADLSGRNLLVDADMRILLCDFSGSAIDGDKAEVRAEAGYRHPSAEESSFPSIRGEIHSLGSTFYEILTAKEVHDGLAKDAVEKLIEEGQYPDVAGVDLGGIIQNCWRGDYTSAADVADAVAQFRRDNV